MPEPCIFDRYADCCECGRGCYDRLYGDAVEEDGDYLYDEMNEE